MHDRQKAIIWLLFFVIQFYVYAHLFTVPEINQSLHFPLNRHVLPLEIIKHTGLGINKLHIIA